MYIHMLEFRSVNIHRQFPPKVRMSTSFRMKTLDLLAVFFTLSYPMVEILSEART